MARSKSASEIDEIAVRPPLAIGRALRDAAERDGLGVGPWCVAVLTDALARGTRVQSRFAVIREGETLSGAGTFSLNEPPAPYGKKPRTGTEG